MPQVKDTPRTNPPKPEPISPPRSLAAGAWHRHEFESRPGSEREPRHAENRNKWSDSILGVNEMAVEF